MAIQNTEGILLKTQDFRETSILLTFFTKDFGKLHGILKGVRGLRSKAEYIPQSFSLNQIIFYEKQKSDLHIITQCEPVQIFLDILKSLSRTLNAYYMVEIVDALSQTHAENKDVFEALYNGMKFLEKAFQPEQIARIFEIKFLIALGVWPGCQEISKQKKITKGCQATLEYFERMPWGVAVKLKLTKDVAWELKNLVRGMIDSNLEHPLKTVDLLKRILFV